jgi:hypothetical protein
MSASRPRSRSRSLGRTVARPSREYDGQADEEKDKEEEKEEPEDADDLIALWEAGPQVLSPEEIAESRRRWRLKRLCWEARNEQEAEDREIRWREEERRREEVERRRRDAMTPASIFREEGRKVSHSMCNEFITFREHMVDMDDAGLAEEVECLITESEVSRGFYIGATQDTVRRWLGDSSAERPMEGHSETWVRRGIVQSYHELEMVMLSARKGQAGPETERFLINRFWGRRGPRCYNVSKEPIGTSGKPQVWNFIYVVRW